ncbi:hypothetical protein [Leifsonia shinshuensis]
MTDELTGEALAARRAQVAEANRKFGKVLSIIGAVLAAVALVLLIVGGILLTWIASDPPALEESSADDLRGLAAVGMSAVPGVLALFGMCGLVAGEQIRRGGMGRNPAPPDTVLPSASFVSRFRVLPTGWHALWTVVGLLVSFVLVGLPVISWFTGGWPGSVDGPEQFAQYWVIYGSIAFGVTVAAAVSLLKKTAYLRALRSGRIVSGRPAPGQAFWRWFDYRWRFDLWLAGLGAMVAVLALTPLSEAVGAGASPGELASALPAILLFLVLGLLFIVAGVVCTLNFWRAGEELGSGESAA